MFQNIPAKILLRNLIYCLAVCIIVRMKIFTHAQIKEADDLTISTQGIASYELMNRMAQEIFDLAFHADSPRNVCIICGKGNNGGDGLALALLLRKASYHVKVFIIEHRRQASDDFIYQLERLRQMSMPLVEVRKMDDLPPQLGKSFMLVDALLGTGVNRPLEGLLAEVVDWMNAQQCFKIAIDIPSGLSAEPLDKQDACIVQVNQTFAIETPKLSCLLPENYKYCGKLQMIDIGWSPLVYASFASDYHCIDLQQITAMYQLRKPNATKHDLGFAQLIAGSKGKAGAAILSAKACLRTGCGLTEVFVPQALLSILQIAAPEAMCSTDVQLDVLSQIQVNKRATAIGIGPGIGLDALTRQALRNFIHQNEKPLVVDADALNIISDDTSLLEYLSGKAILTPHQFEFDRLFGSSENAYQRLQKAKSKAVKYQLVIVLKGMYTAVALPNGEVHFNITGNASLAKGGSGDVLTGIIT
jgi:NAD(P)H-hydrate epimerase